MNYWELKKTFKFAFCQESHKGCEQLRNVHKWKTHVQSVQNFYFSFLNFRNVLVILFLFY